MAPPITTPRADAAVLLEWYDRHHRELPWRVSPAAQADGQRPDPYRVWLSEIMLQQTTVATVKDYFLKFTRAWPDVHALAAAPTEDVMAAWAGLGYYARARNLLKCARVVSEELGGIFPETEAGLRELPGIGPYTAAAIAAIAFDRPAAVVDGNVERVMARLYAETSELPGVKPVLKGHAAILTPKRRPGDYAQAVMDLGAIVCTPRRPACAICPWMTDCKGRVLGIAADLPAKASKAPKPVRHGVAWALFDRDGQVYCVTRPEKGLLGGMLALPASEFVAASKEKPPLTPPVAANWRDIGEIRHVFTHFQLVLRVNVAETGSAREQELPGSFVPGTDAVDAMPTVFAKACRLALTAET
ncbi:MAG: A/G-specific adenine glycosylase [Pseudomonadota bacterium]